MIFVINNLKYDTDHMDLVSNKCQYSWTDNSLGISLHHRGRDVKLWKSKKGNWLLTYERDYGVNSGVALSEEKAKKHLLQYDVEAYEKIFGELEEA